MIEPDNFGGVSMDHSKKELRHDIKKKLELLSEQEQSVFNHQIQDQLFNSGRWNSAKVIGITISRGKEVETRGIIEKAWQEGKKVAVPKCFPNEKRMNFYIITDEYNQLEEVYFGLKEPKVHETTSVEPNQMDLLIVPGICYSENGYRIGYGGGYYDRYLQHFHGDTLSLLFECQLIENISFEKFDIPVKQMITEKRTITCYE
jgi:5-formyltetrahydrofolate cyclo-ligase